MDCLPQENVFDELNNFEKKRTQDVPQVLEEFLNKVAKTGDPMFPWPKIKPLIVYKMEKVFTEFHEFCPTDDLPPCPNVENFDYVNMRKKLIEKIESFSSAPFTIQRLCELITAARKHYKRTDKFMRAVEKTILVVSTIEPCFQSKKTDELVSSPLLNGAIDGSNSSDATATTPAPASPLVQQEVESSDRDTVTAEASAKTEEPAPSSDTGDSSESNISSSREECETEETDAKVTAEEPETQCYASGEEVSAGQVEPESEPDVLSQADSSMADEKEKVEEESEDAVTKEIPNSCTSVRDVRDEVEESEKPFTDDLKCKEFLGIDCDTNSGTENSAGGDSPSPSSRVENSLTDYKPIESVEPAVQCPEEIGESAVAMDTDPCPPAETTEESKSPDSSTHSCLDGEAMCAEPESANVPDQSEPMEQD